MRQALEPRPTPRLAGDGSARSAPAPGDPGRWELIRALGALCGAPPPDGWVICDALGLARWSRAEHTGVFVLDLPPHASIHLGPEGKLGGVGADRVAGMWRALDLQPPADADHLGALLGLYAELGRAGDACRRDLTRRRLEHARVALLAEHLASWVPGYLAAASTHPPAAGWARLTASALAREADRSGLPAALPAALRDAPAAIAAGDGLDELLDALPAPVRTGFVLTHTDLVAAGRQTGLGVRRGERRYTLRAMLEQDPAATFAWLSDHARRWACLHRDSPLAGPARDWWAQRATLSAAVLQTLAGEPR